MGNKLVEKLLNGVSVRVAALCEDDREYWDYINAYGSDEERERAADYFDVDPSAFDYTYDSYHDSECDEAKEQDTSLEDEVKALATDDYQNRNGDYPKSGVPDTIDVFGTRLEIDFKNTPEEAVKKWVETFLNQKGFKYDKVSVYQSGDYQDDWVTANVTVTGKK